MCAGSGLLKLAGSGIGYLVGGPTGGFIGGLIGDALGGREQQQQQPAAAVVATSPLADDAKARADAEAAAVQDANARKKLARSSSLLSMAGGAGDLSTANVSKSNAYGKTTLGA